MGSKSGVIFDEMKDVFDAFLQDATSWVENGNKSAAKRARKATLTLASLGKDFRKASVEEAKG